MYYNVYWPPAELIQLVCSSLYVGSESVYLISWPLNIIVKSKLTCSFTNYVGSESVYLTLASLLFSVWIILRIRAYSARTPKTWMIQDTTHVSTAVRPSALGALAVTELKMLTRTRNRVTSSAMRPENILHYSPLWVFICPQKSWMHIAAKQCD